MEPITFGDLFSGVTVRRLERGPTGQMIETFNRFKGGTMARFGVHPHEVVGVIVPVKRTKRIRQRVLVLAAPYSYFDDRAWS